jgi:tyrosinase
MPSVVSAQTVKITTPSGVKTIKNPLYQYNFQRFPLDPSYFPTGDPYDGELATYNYTVRFPDYVGDGDDIDAANSYLTSAGLTEQVVSLHNTLCAGKVIVLSLNGNCSGRHS